MLAAMSTMLLTASAQKTVQGSQFFDNWSFGLSGGAVSPVTHHSFWGDARGTFGAELTKQITPVFGLGFEGQAGVNTSYICGSKGAVTTNPAIDMTNVSLLGKINLTNLFMGYNGTPRTFELEGVAGAGWGHVFLSESEGPDQNFMTSKFGLNFNFNLGEKKAWTVAVKPALVYRISDGASQQTEAYNINKAGLEMQAGVTYHFKNSNGAHHFTLQRAYDQAEVDGLNAKINDLRGEVREREGRIDNANRRIHELEQELNDCRNRKPVVEKIVNTERSMEQTITFRQGKSAVEAAQLPNVERVATFMKNNKNSRVVIKGYASPEGSAEINERLARERAEAVKDILVKKYKISADRITAEGQGVGDMFSEPDWNRVSICTLEK